MHSNYFSFFLGGGGGAEGVGMGDVVSARPLAPLHCKVHHAVHDIELIKMFFFLFLGCCTNFPKPSNPSSSKVQRSPPEDFCMNIRL